MAVGVRGVSVAVGVEVGVQVSVGVGVGVGVSVGVEVGVEVGVGVGVKAQGGMKQTSSRAAREGSASKATTSR